MTKRNLDYAEAVRLGKTIKELIRAQGWTMLELADRAGLSLLCIQGVIRAKNIPTDNTVSKIAKAFGFTPQELLSYSPEDARTGLTFGERFRALLYDLGMSEREFAEKTHMSTGNVKLLKGRIEPPKREMQELIANSLDVTVPQLITGEGLDDYLRTEVLNCLEAYSPKVNIRVAEEREACGMTEKELSKKAGIGLSTLENIEYGIVYPKYSSIKAISEALGVPCSELMVRISNESV